MTTIFRSNIISGLILLALLVSISSCLTNYGSAAMVNRSYDSIVREFEEKITKDGVQPRTEFKVKNRDTLLVEFTIENETFESFFLFENDKCYYQDLKIYCSPCADQMTQKILQDKFFKFKAINKETYVSQKHPNIILRLRQYDVEQGCNQITIVKRKSE